VNELNSFADVVLAYALERSVAFAVVFLVAAGLWWGTRRWMSSHTGSLWFLLPLAVLLLPLESWIPNPWQSANPIEHLALAVLPAQRISTDSDLAVAEPGLSAVRAQEAVRVNRAAGEKEFAAPVVRQQPALSTSSLILCLWMIGAGFLLWPLMRSQVRVRRLLRTSRHLDASALQIDLAELSRDLGLKHMPDLLESPEFDSPAAWLGTRRRSGASAAGTRARASIILPEGLAARLQPSELRWVLLHELAHLARRDHYTELAQRVLGAVFFFHPFVWATNWMARSYREMACDDAALARCDRRHRASGARALFEVAAHATALASNPRSTILNPRQVPSLTTLSHSKTLTRRRVMRLVATNRPLTRGLRLSAIAPIVLASGVALAAAHFPETVMQDAADGSIERTPVAVTLATDWLLEAQEADGGWSYTRPENELDVTSIAAEVYGAGGQSAFDPYYTDVALTALALEALTRRAEDEPQNLDLGKAVNRAVQHLIDRQDPETGGFGPQEGAFMVGQTLATVAIAKASAGHMTPERQACLEASLGYLRRARNPYAGWRYDSVPSGDNDTRLTGYALLALLAADEVGVTPHREDLIGGLRYMVANEQEETGRTNYMRGSEHAFRVAGREQAFPIELAETPTAMHLLLRAKLGLTPDESPEIEVASALLSTKTPAWDVEKGTIDYSYWWHGTRALASTPGDAWDDWSSKLRGALQENQILSGPMKGTWPTLDAWSAPGMEVYTTAMGALALYEVLDAR